MNKIKVYFKFPNKSKPINVQEKKSADDRQEQAKYENIPIPSSEMKNIATEIKKNQTDGENITIDSDEEELNKLRGTNKKTCENTVQRYIEENRS